MEEITGLAEGWTVWNAEPGGRVVLAYRPDIFNTRDFPAACLPTIVIAPGKSPDHPPAQRYRSVYWHSVLYLEPMVRVRDLDDSTDSREDAIKSAVEISARFVSGDIDYHAVYQDPRDKYLGKLDDLIGK